MAKVKIAINGFGRIGRLVLKVLAENPNQYPDIEVVAINDISKLEVLAYMLKYDSVYRGFKGTVEVQEDNLIINGKTIKFYANTDPATLPWKELGVDYVLESTGIFVDTAKPANDPRKHLAGGAKRVLVSAPCKQDADVKTVVIGVNHKEYDPAVHTLISNASCTTNGLAPLVKVLHDNWGVETGLMTTVHAYTSTQKMVDTPVNKTAPDRLRMARAGALSIIPSTTGAAKAVGLVMPEMKGKLTGMAFRVPTPTGSVVDLTVILKKDATLDEIAAKVEEAANTPLEEGGMKGIFGFTKDPLVSMDIVGDSRSSIFDYHAGVEFKDNKRFFKLVTWYDNEYGYACRIADLLQYMASQE